MHPATRAIFARVLGALIGAACGVLAAKANIVVDQETQTAIQIAVTLAVYGGVHRADKALAER